jgi:hypothetical protein
LLRLEKLCRLFCIPSHRGTSQPIVCNSLEAPRAGYWAHRSYIEFSSGCCLLSGAV